MFNDIMKSAEKISITSNEKTVLDSVLTKNEQTTETAKLDFLLLSLILFTSEKQFKLAQVQALANAANVKIESKRLLSHYTDCAKVRQAYKLYEITANKPQQVITITDKTREKIIAQKTVILSQMKNTVTALHNFIESQQETEQAQSKQAQSKQAQSKQAANSK